MEVVCACVTEQARQGEGVLGGPALQEASSRTRHLYSQEEKKKKKKLLENLTAQLIFN